MLEDRQVRYWEFMRDGGASEAVDPLVLRVRELFDLRDGVLYWKVSLSNRVAVGDKAGVRTGRQRYGYVGFDGKQYATHRVIYMHHYGVVPDVVDHADGDVDNNRPENLRNTTQGGNLRNTSRRADNTSGRKGVSFEAGKYRAYINVDGRRLHLGRFGTLEEAIATRQAAELEYHGEYAKFDPDASIQVYLAGSLRNPKIPLIARNISDGLRTSQIFYQWHSAGPNADDHWRDHMQSMGLTYAEALRQPASENVYNFDKKYIDASRCMVLAYPAGKSGHLELGYHLGRGKPGFILLDGEPERYDVMTKFATGVASTVDELVDMLRPHLNMAEGYPIGAGDRT